MEESFYPGTKPFPESTPSVPVEKKQKNGLILVAVLCLVFGAGIFGTLTYLGYTNGFMTDGQCLEQSNLYYAQGIIDVANFTTLTGNFTYIYNGSINTQGVQDYCVGMIQQLNLQEVK